MLTFTCRCGVAAMLLLLAGCAGSGGWTKPGTDAALRSADFSDCQDLSRQQTQRQYAIDSDIMASRGSDWHRSGTFNLETDRINSDPGVQTDQIIAGCMHARGYTKGG